MMCRRPGFVSSDIKRQTHRFAESAFVIFENLRARKMSHDFPVRGSGRFSFGRYAFRSGMSNRVSHHRPHTKLRALSAAVVLIEALAQRMCCRSWTVGFIFGYRLSYGRRSSRGRPFWPLRSEIGENTQLNHDIPLRSDHSRNLPAARRTGAL